MKFNVHWAGALLAGILGLAAGAVFPALSKDTEADLEKKIARETNPVKRAKQEVRLARIKLQQAMQAHEDGDHQVSLNLLDAYLARVSSAWDTLKASGRVAQRQPQGFKELDIGLRGDLRYLEDLERSVPVMEREPVEKVIKEVERIRAEVLKGLFPTMESPAR